MHSSSGQGDSGQRQLFDAEQLLFLAENVEDVIFRYRLHPTLGMEYVSPGVERLMGYTVEEYHADPHLAFRTIHRDDTHLVKQMLQSLSNTPTPLIIRVVRKEGTVIWTEQRMRTVDGGDTLVGWRAT